ncbi:kininogen-1 [Mugil cephalus]|uniref:kininogen-1 n=1 Tax=Mugil cephalus TaxID=48193 RepID=UPI001FB6A507|nr:kininogen-1 [Mugil cephalus]XP_047443260.1 kininogen-1 [Mugil cephalus]
MRSRVGLFVLGLLCLHSSVFGQDADQFQLGVLVFCDDPSVDKAVGSALEKFNEKLSTGHKLALFQVLTASKSVNGSDLVYSLQFTSRRSDCLAGSSKPWSDCDYLPHGRRKPISCNATVTVTETEADTTQVECVLDDHIFPEKAPCLGCPEEIDEDSEDLRVPLSVSISKYNAISDSTHLFGLNKVGHATRQVVAGFRFKLRFDMKKTKCSKAEHKDLNELCVADDENVEFANCNSTVDVAPWRLEPPAAHIQCEPGALPPTIFTRRRPPGWSPLRHILYGRPSAASPTASAPQSTQKPESSEEDAASKPSASPDVVGDDNPFHCPSKPWKPFQPVYEAPPVPTGVGEAAAPKPTGVFSDTDLLS